MALWWLYVGFGWLYVGFGWLQGGFGWLQGGFGGFLLFPVDCGFGKAAVE
jgi:hypothetical protein